MTKDVIKIIWPNGKTSTTQGGQNWLKEAEKQGFKIPTGCLTGSCGACEIEVNGKIIRACIQPIRKAKTGIAKVEIWEDPYW